MMQSPCSRTSVVRNMSDDSVATNAVRFIRPPPGLELPAARNSQAQGLAAPLADNLPSVIKSAFDGDADANTPEETSIAREKLKSFLEAARDDEYTIRLAQQAHLNLAVARLAQQVWYAQHAQIGDCATAITQANQPRSAMADPKNANATSTLQHHSLGRCGGEFPKRPPGVWTKPPRASSCSSGSSTRASSNDELRTRRAHKLQLDVPTHGFFGSGGKRVCWPVDARKLNSNDIQIVSPSFELYPSSEFKLLIKTTAPTSRGQRKRAGFKHAHGRGSIELKCVSGFCLEHSLLTFRLSLIDGGRPQARSVVTHDFRQEPLYVPKESESWDFAAAVNDDSQAFFVCLEVAHAES